MQWVVARSTLRPYTGNDLVKEAASHFLKGANMKLHFEYSMIARKVKTVNLVGKGLLYCKNHTKGRFLILLHLFDKFVGLRGDKIPLFTFAYVTEKYR